jgi:PhoPQ-activated pathogenicity-related protein
LARIFAADIFYIRRPRDDIFYIDAALNYYDRLNGDSVLRICDYRLLNLAHIVTTGF